MTVSTDVWQPLGKLDDLGVGDKREVTLPNGKIILLINAEGRIHAVCADCPHQETPLIEGSVEGTVLACPLHFWQWDITTGEEIGLAELPLEIFKLRQENGEWFIRS
jgi:toluene monooxygenase system ferredoxin subunit